MGARGPKKGFKKQPADGATQAPVAKKRAQPAPAAADDQAAADEPMSAAHRANPSKLSGQALRDLAHQRGMSRSEMAGMSDEKIRQQVRFLIYRQYETAEAT